MKNIESQSSMQLNVFEKPQNKYNSQFSKYLLELMIYEKKIK